MGTAHTEGPTIPTLPTSQQHMLCILHSMHTTSQDLPDLSWAPDDFTSEMGHGNTEAHSKYRGWVGAHGPEQHPWEGVAQL